MTYEKELTEAAAEVRFWADKCREIYAIYLEMVTQADKATAHYERVLKKGGGHEPGSDGPARAASETT